MYFTRKQLHTDLWILESPDWRSRNNLAQLNLFCRHLVHCIDTTIRVEYGSVVMSYGTHEYYFHPLTHTTPDHVAYLAGLFNEQGVAARFALTAHRRRGAWGSTLPVGVFDNDFRANACTWEQHAVARDRTFVAARAECFRNQRPYLPAYDVLEADGSLYYHPEAMRVFARFVAHPAFLLALSRFLEAADKSPTLIVAPRRRAPFVPLERRQATFGHAARGPSWEPDEDAVLRRWFGQRTVGAQAGRHVKLSDAEWVAVLAELPRRNKNSARNRLVELNRALQHEFFRDGFVARDQLPKYMARVLGERPRIPIRPAKRRRL